MVDTKAGTASAIVSIGEKGEGGFSGFQKAEVQGIRGGTEDLIDTMGK